MALLRSLPENATLADLRRSYADLLEKLRPYGQRLMRDLAVDAVSASSSPRFVSGVNSCGTVRVRIPWSHGAFGSMRQSLLPRWTTRRCSNRCAPQANSALCPQAHETPSRMTAADAAAVYDAGWNDEALLHAIAVCAYFNRHEPPGRSAGIVGSPEDYSVAARGWSSTAICEAPWTREIPNEVQISFDKAPHKAQAMTMAVVDDNAPYRTGGRRQLRRCKMPFFPSMPEDATTKHVFAAHPEIYSHWVRVSEAILRGPSPLTPVRES